MKRYLPLVVLFAAGVAASLALAAPPPGHGPPTSSNTSSTTTSTGPGKSGSHAPKSKCRPINLKGTVSAGAISLQVTKAAGPKAKDLLNTTANLTVNGPVSVQAWICASSGGSAPTQALVLRQLRVGGSPHLPATTTTTTTTP